MSGYAIEIMGPDRLGVRLVAGPTGTVLLRVIDPASPTESETVKLDSQDLERLREALRSVENEANR